MKLVSYLEQGKHCFGAVVPLDDAADEGLLDLSAPFQGRFPDLRTLIGSPEGLAEAASLAADARAKPRPLAELLLAPVIPNPDKIVCVGLNYEEHRKESRREKTEQPALFLRLPASQQGHRQALRRPAESVEFDFEGEIAIVIGKAGRRIDPAHAWAHVAGYSCYNDGSVREWQRHTLQWTPGKNFEATGGFGPWLVTSDEIEPGAELTLVTRLNGQEMQRATTEVMIHPIPKLIAYVSTFVSLVPGDVIVTGTPGGVGMRREPPVFMKPGDVVEIEVDRVGTLVNEIVAD